MENYCANCDSTCIAWGVCFPESLGDGVIFSGGDITRKYVLPDSVSAMRFIENVFRIMCLPDASKILEELGAVQIE